MGGGRDDERLAAHRHLGGLDDSIAALVAAHGPVDAYRPTTPSGIVDPLAALALHVTGQQISRIAALAIFGRLTALLGGTVDAARLAAESEDALRCVGLSRAKARALRELGERVASGALDFAALAELDDDEATRRLVALPGIGPWSAQVFLLRDMRRPDVFPSGDIALRRGLVLLDGLAELPSPAWGADRALAWRPWRSYAAAHLWRSYALARGEPVAPIAGGPGDAGGAPGAP
ncbi:MAG: DNA-3-methyladenine glycosylase [Miltoncostaeaceae bacterium]|jgi:DNA-3-methyladenine glycosylase II|nr:DNA-3-methyladenine glycosylase [Miltoncostaeaceae bacterium]